MFLKNLGAKYFSKYKSHSAPWSVTLENSASRSDRFVIDELTVEVDRSISGKGKDAGGAFKINGQVNTKGFAEFEKRYTDQAHKLTTQFHGNFTNCFLSGNWVIKGIDTGKFNMKIEGAKSFALQLGSQQEVIYLAFFDNNTILHSVGILKSSNSPEKRFFILNGKISPEDKHVTMKLSYPQHSQEDFYTGDMLLKDGRIVIRGVVESYITSKLIGSKSGLTENFTLTSLPQVQTPPDNMPMGIDENTSPQKGDYTQYPQPQTYSPQHQYYPPSPQPYSPTHRLPFPSPQEYTNSPELYYPASPSSQPYIQSPQPYHPPPQDYTSSPQRYPPTLRQQDFQNELAHANLQNQLAQSSPSPEQNNQFFNNNPRRPKEAFSINPCPIRHGLGGIPILHNPYSANVQQNQPQIVQRENPKLAGNRSRSKGQRLKALQTQPVYRQPDRGNSREEYR